MSLSLRAILSLLLVIATTASLAKSPEPVVIYVASG
jgi:hypothetical protein